MKRAHHRIEQQHTTLLIAESAHRMRTVLDCTKETFEIVVGANRAPVLLRKIIEAQAVIQVSTQTL